MKKERTPEETRELHEKAEDAYSMARAKLVLSKESLWCFFASLAMRLGCRVDENVETACTDGREIKINPEFWLSLSDEEQITIVAHEVMHPALLHHTRRMGRDPLKWNIAADAAINQILVDSKFKLPKDCVMPGKFPLSKAPMGLTAEEYYPLIDDEYEKQKKKYVLIGDVTEGDEEGEANSSRSEADWKAAVSAAHDSAKKRGTTPGWMDKIVQAILEPKVDWRTELVEYLKVLAKSDYRWSPPNRRHIHAGMYLPAMSGETIGDVVFFIDTSGSCWDDDTLSRFASECQGVLDAYDCKVWLVYCDTNIQKVDEWEPGDGELTISPKGGGGTSHVECWKWLEETDVDPCVAICLTDGWTDFGEEPQGTPIIWALTDKNIKPPFGKPVYVID